MAAKLTFNGEQFKEHLKNATADGLQLATVFYHTECRRTVSVPNPRNRKTGEYDSPSQPGEAPRLRTGHGQSWIVQEFDREALEGRVGVAKNGLYMFWLEIGTRFVARRPWLYATLLKHAETIGRLASLGSQRNG